MNYTVISLLIDHNIFMSYLTDKLNHRKLISTKRCIYKYYTSKAYPGSPIFGSPSYNKINRRGHK